MKKLFVAFLCFAVSQVVNAKIWRVNNVPGVAADFTTAQAAHDGAAAGDTIYLESSPTNYGDITTTKKLVWIGLGGFLNVNLGLQNHANTGRVNNITVNAGSDGSIFQIANFDNQPTVSINAVSNISFIRSYLQGSLFINNTASHISFTESFLDLGNGNFIVGPTSTQFGFVFTNNIIRVNYININNNAYQVIFNNNTLYTNGNPYNVLKIDNATISNNIFYNVGVTILNDAGYPSNVTSNLWVGGNNTNYVGTNGNIYAADATSVFIGGTSPDAQYKLKPGSPAIGTGAGNVDIGAYGGANPYVVSLIPAIPTIYQLSVPANATGSSLPVTVSTRANN
jgi:hypothetical protein